MMDVISMPHLGTRISMPPLSSLSSPCSLSSPLKSGGQRVTIRSTNSSPSLERKERERKEATNRKIASQKAISVILRREATKAVIEKKRGPASSKKLLPRTVLEALHERIAALRWESALKVFELLREQFWYKPNAGIYIKLIVMLGKCKQPEKAQILFHAMVDEGCSITREAYTALVSAYGRSGLLGEAFSLLEEMKGLPECLPDIYVYSILLTSCLKFFAFDKVQSLLDDMMSRGIRPNTVVYNTLIDGYGKASKFEQMEKTLIELLGDPECKPDIWTMNATLRAFGNTQQVEMMEKCYEKFQASGIEPNINTFNILLHSYGRSKMYDKMGAIMEYMQNHYFSWTLVTYNVLIDAFSRAGDLDQMGYLFRLMKSEKVKPNCMTLSSLVRAYGRVQNLEKLMALMRFIENSDVTLDTAFFNCLIDAYGRIGCLAEMRQVLLDMEKKGCKPDKITYSTMIKAYSSRGMSNHVNELKRIQLI